MSYFSVFLTLAAIWALVVISPGPCFVATVQQATRGSSRDGVFVALGIATGTIIWCAGSLLGLAVLFATLSWLYQLVRLAGAIYLMYLGLKTIRHAHQPLPPAGLDATPIQRGSAWRVGFLTDISNPKAAAFFGSLFAALLPVHAPLWVLVTAVLLVIMIEFMWYCLMAYLFARKPVARVYRRAQRWIDYIAGGLYMLLGGRLALAR
jgi:threonine efflux protein